ncbi:MAG: hypothetical protein GTN49_11845 [candidate division Zixibacteria bacterium]|nr:hypothetical protein [candidate division Zixibacteria bacterium]
MKVDPVACEVSFLSLFERRFVPVEPERAEKALALTAFLRDAPLQKGNGLEFDYPLRNKIYHFRLYVASLGKLRLTTWPGREFRCARLAGGVTGWDRDRRTTIDAYVANEGEFARRILKLTFKFTDWPGVTLTLSGDAN